MIHKHGKKTNADGNPFPVASKKRIDFQVADGAVFPLGFHGGMVSFQNSSAMVNTYSNTIQMYRTILQSCERAHVSSVSLSTYTLHTFDSSTLLLMRHYQSGQGLSHPLANAAIKREKEEHHAGTMENYDKRLNNRKLISRSYQHQFYV